MTSSTWTAEYCGLVRDFMAERGCPVKTREKRYDWERDDEVSTYGWEDFEAQRHVKPYVPDEDGAGCGWVVPEGARLYERSYSQFADTNHGNDNEVGINVRGCRCECGEYQDVILRWTGSLAEIMQAILGLPTQADIEVVL